jgi:DNA-binding CsgD family transcriptional regulator/tetratricopeptide (TPR) repeat protein
VVTDAAARLPSCPALVGRAAPLATLERAVDDTIAGNGGVVLLDGDAGIGKSRLAAEVRRYAAPRGVLVLEGTCFPSDRTCPYALCIDLVRSHLSGKTPDAVAALVGAFGADLHPLMPDLVPPPAADVPPLPPEQARRRLMSALAQAVLGAGAEQPVLIVTEDLHWCDGASLDVLHTVARQTARRPILLLGTYRGDDAGEVLASWLAGLTRERLLRAMHLGPLEPDHVVAMIAAIAGGEAALPARSVESLVALAEGNPFYVEELLASHLDAGAEAAPGLDGAWSGRAVDDWPLPGSLRHAVLDRARRLSPAGRDVLRVAAVIGRRFDLALLQRVCRIDDSTLFSLIREAIDAGLIVEEADDRLTFRHALIRQGIYEELLGQERAVLHRVVGEEAESRYATFVERHAGDLAHHFTAAGSWEKAFVYARMAGEHARSIHAPRVAVEQFRRALEAGERLRAQQPTVHEQTVVPVLRAVYRERGRAYEQLGEFDEAASDHEAAAEGARAVADHRGRWQALSELGMLWARRDYGRADIYLQEALTLARALRDPSLIAASLNRVGNWRVNVDEPRLGLTLHKEALAIAERLGDRHAIGETVDLLGVASYFGADLPEAVAWYRRAVDLFRELDDPRGLVTGLAMLAFLNGARDMLPLALGDMDVDAGVRDGEEAVQVARSIDWPAGEAFALFQLAIALSARGEYGRALELAERGLRIAEEIGHQQWRTLGHCTLGVLSLDLLTFQPAQAHLQRTLALGREINSSFWMRYGAARLAVAHVARGDLRQADAVLASEPAASGVPIASLTGWWRRYAEARRALAARAPDRALSLLDQLAPAAGDGRREGDTAMLAIARAEALTALGRTDAAEAALLPVQEAMHQHGVRSQLWRGHVALGGVYRAQGRDVDARREFAAARLVIEEIAGALSDGPLRGDFLKRATGLLPAAYRLTPRRALTTRFGGLTEREREVASLVARGRSNREIGEALVLGRRTVETHVANALAKIGGSSRRELAAWAVDQGLSDEAP